MDVKAAGLALIRVERVDPPVMPCAACGWTPLGCWPADSTSKLVRAVIDHWRLRHWVAGVVG